MLLIESLSSTTCAAWDAYVQQATAGLPQHLSGWRYVLEKSYGYETCYLAAKREDQVVGVLPLFFVRSPLLGKRAMTMPGGLCADTPEAAQALLDQARTVAKEAGMKRLILQDTRQLWAGCWQTSQAHCSWRLDLASGEAQLWQGLDRNIRRQVRMARENNLRVEITHTPQNLDAFYQVFSRFAHQAGTPIFARRFLEQISEQFPGGYNILSVYQEEKPIAGYFQLEMGETLYGVWGAALHEYLKLRPVYLAYWELIADGCRRGFRTLDMGRSPQASTAAAFKAQWGATPVPIYQQVGNLGNRPVTTTHATSMQVDHKFQLFQQLWPKLPFSVAQSLGPHVRWHLPFA